MSADQRTRRLLQFGAPATLVALLFVSGTAPVGASAGIVIKEPQYGFSFVLPSKWKRVPLNGSSVSALLNAATHGDPTLANGLNKEIKSAASEDMKVFVIGPISGTTVPNVNVIVTSSAGSPSGSEFAPAAAAEAKIELTEIGASQIKTSVASDRLGRAAVATYRLDLKGSPRQFGEQLYVRHDANIDIVTVTTSNLAHTQSVARLLTNSWRW